MYKYLLEKDYKENDINAIDRKLFNSPEKLFEYLIKNKDTIFNSGFHSAEVRLNRIEVQE